MRPFEAYISDLMLKERKHHEQIAKHINLLMASEAGVALSDIARAMLEQMRNEFLYLEDDNPVRLEQKRAEIRGGIVALQTFVATLRDFAMQHEEEPDAKTQPAWATSEDDDEPAL